MGFEDIFQAAGVGEQQGAAAPQVVRHGERIGDEHAPVLFQVSLGDDQGAVQSRLHTLAEPPLQPVVEEEHGKQRDKHRRHERNDREQHREPHMKLGAAAPPPPLAPERHDPDSDHCRQQHQQYEVDDEQGDDILDGRRNDGHRAGHHQIGKHAGERREAGKGEGGRPAHNRVVPEAREHQRRPRTTGISRYRIFLRSVFRLRPRISADLIWLPFVAARQCWIRGRSTSRRIRS